MRDTRTIAMAIPQSLLAWYAENKRILPWREDVSAYRVWVSEIMLQQTRVEAVKPYFYRFMEMLPTIEALSQVDDDVLHKLWEGLGYYSRVRNMKKAAMICMEKYGGALPSSYEELLALPGIGPYTAGAIASIAFHRKVCAIDGNVLRVYARLFDLHEDIMEKATQKKIHAIMQNHLCDNMGDFNQALMDLGSGICVPNGAPRCNICPLAEDCLGYQKGSASKLPVRKKKKARRKECYTLYIYVCNQEVLLHKRADKGMLAGLYEFVLEEGYKNKKDVLQGLYLGAYKHIFTHVEWHMKGFLIPVEKPFEKEGCKWIPYSLLTTHYSIPGAFAFYRQKLYDYMEKPRQK